MAPEISFVVYEEPGPQGSKSPKGRDKQGRAILVESSKKVRPWREAVKHAAMEAIENSGRITGPVRTVMIFTVRKPAGRPKKKVTYPDRRPDLSKLVRSTEDALSQVLAYEDDSRIIDTLSGKRYPNEGQGALDSPGAFIKIIPVT